MKTYPQITRRASVTRPALILMAGALAASLVLPVPADAQGFGFRAAGASGQNGAAAGSRGIVSNGQGGGAVGRKFAIGDGEGNGAAGVGRCATTVHAAGCSGRAATWGSDGTFSGRAGTEITGENGFISGNRSLDRDAEGNWSGASALDATGQNGSYSGTASLDNGAYSRDATYSGNDGQSATVEGSFEAGSGGSRSVTCIDASGAVVDCP